MNRVFIVRPFGTQSNVDFHAVDAQLIQPALRAAGLEGSTTATLVEAGNLREDMFRLPDAELVEHICVVDGNVGDDEIGREECSSRVRVR